MAVRWKRHDTGLFAVDVPPGWVAVENPRGTLLVRDGESSVALTLSAVATPGEGGAGNIGPASRTPRVITAKGVQGQLEQWIGKQRQVQVRQAPRLVNGTFHLTCTTEGLERLRAGVAWWRRVLGRGPLMLWRFWAVANEHLLLLGSCNGRPEAVERQRQVVDRVIMSIHLTNRDLLIGRNFTEAVVSLARDQFPLTAVALIDEEHMRFGARAVDLRGLHRRYLQSPEELGVQVRRFFSELQRRLESEGEVEAGGWEKVRHRLLPVLATPDRVSQYGPRCAHEEWINGLEIVYVLEEGEGAHGGAGQGASRGVTVEDCQDWERDVDALHEQALENLVERSGELTMEGNRTEGYTMLALATADRHNAARILLPDLYRKLREHLGQTFYVAIPSREFLLVFSTKREDVLGRIRRQIADDYERAEHPVSPKLFQVTPDGIAGDPEEEEAL